VYLSQAQSWRSRTRLLVRSERPTSAVADAIRSTLRELDPNLPAPDITTLEQTIGKLREGGADVILMNPQFNPRADAVIQTNPYTEAIRWVATGNGVNLFDRQAIMRQWGELGTFDLLAATKSLDTAANVHECIGRLLAGLVVQGAAAEGEDQKEKTTK